MALHAEPMQPMQRMQSGLRLALALFVSALWAGVCQADASDPSPRLLLAPATPVHEAWPNVTVFTEKQKPLTRLP